MCCILDFSLERTSKKRGDDSVRLKIQIPISDELYDLYRRLALFLGCDPEDIIRDRCRTHLESLPEDLASYLEKKIRLR